MTDEERQQIDVTIDGLKVVVSVALNMLPPDVVAARLRVMEDVAREQNLRLETIVVIRGFRERFEAK